MRVELELGVGSALPARGPAGSRSQTLRGNMLLKRCPETLGLEHPHPELATADHPKLRNLRWRLFPIIRPAYHRGRPCGRCPWLCHRTDTGEPKPPRGVASAVLKEVPSQLSCPYVLTHRAGLGDESEDSDWREARASANKSRGSSGGRAGSHLKGEIQKTKGAWPKPVSPSTGTCPLSIRHPTPSLSVEPTGAVQGDRRSPPRSPRPRPVASKLFLLASGLSLLDMKASV